MQTLYAGQKSVYHENQHSRQVHSSVDEYSDSVIPQSQKKDSSPFSRKPDLTQPAITSESLVGSSTKRYNNNNNNFKTSVAGTKHIVSSEDELNSP